MLVLHQLRPGPSAETWEVSESAAEVGRAGAVALSDKSVSRRHARIAFADGGFVVEDLGSKNGTFVNNRQITTASVIADGDELGFGDVVLVAEIRQPATPPAASATIMYVAETPLPIPGVAPAADLTVAEEPTGPPIAAPRQLPRAVHQDLDPESTRQPVMVEAPAGVEPPRPQHARGLHDVVQSAHGTLAWLRELDSQVGPAMELFERGGGRAAVKAFVAQAERVESNPGNAAELQALTAWLPTARRLLEAELALVNLLSARGSDAHH